MNIFKFEIDLSRKKTEQTIVSDIEAIFANELGDSSKNQEYLKEELKKIPEVIITSPVSSTPFILSFALTVHKGSVIAEALSNEGIYVSTKSACSSREAGYSYVLKNAGYDEKVASNGIRLSFSGYETLEQGKDFIDSLKRILNTIKVKEV